MLNYCGTLQLFEHIEENKVLAMTSELTLAEVLVKPFMQFKTHITNIYKNLLNDIRKNQMMTDQSSNINSISRF